MKTKEKIEEELSKFEQEAAKQWASYKLGGMDATTHYWRWVYYNSKIITLKWVLE